MLEPTETSRWGEEGVWWGSIPFQSAHRDQMASGRVGMVPRTVSGAGQLHPRGFLSQDGPQGPGRSQTRSRVHRSAAATRAGLGELPAGLWCQPGSESGTNPAKTPQNPKITPWAPKQSPCARSALLSVGQENTANPSDTFPPLPQPRLLQPAKPGAAGRRSCDTTVP